MEKPNYVAQKSDWLPFLDGIRGFASLWVIVGHCIQNSGWNFPILSSPGFAVDIFMVMSGFLMAYHHRIREKSQPWNSPLTWYTFYIRRFFRIAPLYYLLLIPAFTLNQHFNAWQKISETVFPRSWASSIAGSATYFRDIDLSNIILHVSFIFGLLPQYASSTVLPDWSIGLEMQFYAVFPLIMLLLKRYNYFYISICLWSIDLISNKLFTYNTPNPGLLGIFPQPSFLPLKLSFFLIGILLAEAYYYKSKNSSLSSYLILLAIIISGYKHSIFILFLSIMIVALLFYDRESDLLRIGRGIKIVQKILSNKISHFMADTSYSVYLAHELILIPSIALLASFAWYVSLPGIVRFSLLFLEVASLTYCLGWLLYNHVEKPGITLGKAILKRFPKS